MYSISAVRFDPITGLFGNEGERHHPAVVAFFAQIPLEPVASGAGFRDNDEVRGLCLHLADVLIAITLADANGSQRVDLGAVSLRDIGDRDRIRVDIHTDAACARLGHG